MKNTLIGKLALLTLVLSALPAQAHHSWPVDMDTLVTVKGTVTDFMWQNPHPMMTLDSLQEQRDSPVPGLTHR